MFRWWCLETSSGLFIGRCYATSEALEAAIIAGGRRASFLGNRCRII